MTITSPALSPDISIQPVFARQNRPVFGPAGGDSVLFSGQGPATGFNRHEIRRLSGALKRFLSADQLKAVQAALQEGKTADIDCRYLAGFLYPDGSVKGSDPQFEALGKHLLSDDAVKKLLPANGLPVAVRVRDLSTREPVKEFLEEEVIPAHKMEVVRFPGEKERQTASETKRLRLRNKKQEDGPKPLKVHEAVAWPFLAAAMAGETVGENARHLQEKLDDLPVYDLFVAEGSDTLQSALQTRYKPLKQRLAALEVAKMAYSGRVNVREVITSLLIGSGVGASGELLTHHYLHGGTAAAIARFFVLTGVDVIDNFFGEMGVLTSDLEANGIELSRQSVFGSFKDRKRTGNFIKDIWHYLKMNGPAGFFAKRSIKSALKGAGVGATLSPWIAISLSNPGTPTAIKSLTGGANSMGTAAAIPFNVRTTMPQIYLTVRHLIDQGVIRLPEGIDADDEAAVKEYAKHVGRQEMMSRLGFNASMKAFVTTPASGLILAAAPALMAAGMPPDVAQTATRTAFMTVAPAMENLARMMYMGKSMKFTIPRHMRQVEKFILSSADHRLNDDEKQTVENLFADRPSKFIYDRLTTRKSLPDWKNGIYLPDSEGQDTLKGHDAEEVMAEILDEVRTAGAVPEEWQPWVDECRSDETVRQGIDQLLDEARYEHHLNTFRTRFDALMAGLQANRGVIDETLRQQIDALKAYSAENAGRIEAIVQSIAVQPASGSPER